MNRLDELRAKRSEIYAIAKRHKVKRLYVFGSCARREDTPESDVDFITEFESPVNFFDYYDLQADLSKLLACNIDLIDAHALQND